MGSQPTNMAGFGSGGKGAPMGDIFSRYASQAGLSGGGNAGIAGLTANATPAAAGTVPPSASLPPTTNDAAMGPSYMPAQPSMAGAPVAAAPPAAPKPVAAKPKVAAKPTTKAPPARNPEYQLKVPTGNPGNTDMGWYKTFVDNWNNNPNQTLGGYLSTRDQLAQLVNMGNARGRNRGGSSGGGNYGSSGPSSGGGRLA